MAGETIDREGVFLEVMRAALRKLQADPSVRVDLSREIEALTRLLEGRDKP